MSAWAYSRTGKQSVDQAGGIPASLPDKELQESSLPVSVPQITPQCDCYSLLDPVPSTSSSCRSTIQIFASQIKDMTQ